MENKTTNLEWYAEAINKMTFVDIIPLDNSKRFYRFKLRNPNVDFKKTINKNQIGFKSKYYNYNLRPYWKLYFRGREYNKDLKQIYRYLQDSLLEYQPFFIIESRNSCNLYGNLVSVKIYNYGNSTYSHHNHYAYFDILLEKSINLPNTLRGVSFVFKSKLLPNHRYEYGYCGSLDGRFRNCSLHGYFTNGGGTLDVHPWGYCQTFDKAKGNSNIKCKIDIGT